LGRQQPALLIDESYNANPVSMGATLRSLAAEKIEGRRLAVLGTMLELGEFSDEAHAGLAPIILETGVDELFLVGEPTRPLADALQGKLQVTLVANASEATDALLARLGPGDAVLVKASNGIGLASLVERVAGGRAPCST
jgi:UDP-N-acetylmuramoyl-tripeptide--D-alanyl-D-alanine ligase